MTAALPPAQVAVAYSPAVQPYITTGTNFVGVYRSEAERKWAQVIGALRELEALRDDWDGQGAESPPLAVVLQAVRVANSFREAGQVSPATATATPAGTVLFTWVEDPIYFEVEVVSPIRLEWMLKEQGKATTHGEVEVVLESLTRQMISKPREFVGWVSEAQPTATVYLSSLLSGRCLE